MELIKVLAKIIINILTALYCELPVNFTPK